ncbi:MAG: hypothetical protein MJB14_09155 [Spirochaetes bacterium]|nr:hypothetical protein [Spirochaetota bacterium]
MIRVNYFGARYLDPQTSRWLSCDPAFSRYLGNNPAKLPGIGGVFNPVNLNAYQYSANNPIMYTDPDGELIHPINRYKADVQRQWAAQFVQLGQNTELRSDGSVKYNLYDYGCYVTALTNVLNSFKHDEYDSNPNNIYTIYDSNNVKDAFLDGDGFLKKDGVGALKILNQNKYVKSLGIQYFKKNPNRLSNYANDPNNLYLIVGEEEKESGGQHFFNILSAPDADGNIQCWDGWQKESPYVTKNINDLKSIRVFKIPDKDLYNQLIQLNMTGVNPAKSYLEAVK